MTGGSAARVTPYFTGTEMQICWVSVTRQLVPQGSVVQVMQGVPWQATVTAPTSAVGVRTTGAVTSTHCVLILLHPLTGQDSSAG